MSTLVLERAPRTALIDRRPPLSRLTALEIRKSLSTRSGRALVGAAALLPAAAVAVLQAAGNPAAGATEMLGILGTLVAVLMVAVGVLATAAEWTHRTAQTTFLLVPRRGRALAAKYGAAAVLGAAVGAVVVGTTYAVAAVGAGADFSWADAGPAGLALVAGAVAMTVIGAGVGAALGNTPAALTGSYVVLLVGMTMLRAVSPAAAERIDPVTATATLIGGDGPATRSAAVLIGWVLVTTIAGAIATHRRPVS